MSEYYCKCQVPKLILDAKTMNSRVDSIKKNFPTDYEELKKITVEYLEQNITLHQAICLVHTEVIKHNPNPDYVDK